MLFLSFFLSFFLVFLTTTIVNSQIIPPDFYEGEVASHSHQYYENQGQVIDTDGQLHPEIKYYTMNAGSNIYLADDKVSLTTFVPRMNLEAPDTLYRIDMEPYNTTPATYPIGHEQSQDYLNFYLGHCQQGITEVYGYARVIYQEFMEDIDLHVYSNANGIKLFFVIHPGGSPSNLQLKFTGQDNIAIINNQLRMYMGAKYIELPEGVAYEVNPITGAINPLGWTPTFINGGNGVVQFNSGSYTSGSLLVIEVAEQVLGNTPNPVANIDWSTYYGGSGGVDELHDVHTDNNKNILVTGETYAGNFPITNGSVLGSFGQDDAVLLKFNENAQRQWATYFGGDKEDVGYTVTTTSTNDIFLAGKTFSDSSSFPLKQGTAVTFDNVNGCSSGTNCTPQDAFIAKFDPNGTNLFATYWGYDDGSGVIYDAFVDDNDNLFVGGGNETIQVMGNNPSTQGAGFVAQFDANFNSIWATQYGGVNNGCEVRGLAQDKFGNIFITGNTHQSTNFPIIPENSNSYQSTFNGNSTGVFDAFIAKYNTNQDLVWSTYYGGSGIDVGHSIGVNKNGEVFICGKTASSDFDFLHAGGNAYIDSTHNGNQDAFLSKFSNTGEHLHATFYGGFSDDEGTDLLIDNNDNVYVTGYTESTSNFVQSYSSTTYYFQSTISQNANNFLKDNILLVFDKNVVPIWLTYFGGTSFDNATAITLAPDSKLYMVGTAGTDFVLEDLGNNAYYQSTTNLAHGFITRFLLDPIMTATTPLISSNSDFSISPNPSTGLIQLNLENNNNPFNLSIFHTSGKYISSFNSVQNHASIDLSDLPKGMYIIQLTIDGKTTSRKLLLF